MYQWLALSEVTGQVRYVIGAPTKDGHVLCRPEATAAAPLESIGKVGSVRLVATFTEMRPDFMHVLLPQQQKHTSPLELSVAPGQPHELSSPQTQINLVANPGALAQPYVHSTTLSVMVSRLFFFFSFFSRCHFFVSSNFESHRVQEG